MADSPSTSKDLQATLGLLLQAETRRRRWRFLALLMLVVLIATLFVWPQAGQNISPRADHVARLNITGFIFEDPHFTDFVESLATNDNVRAVVAYIDSPGGTMVGGLEVYHALRRVAENKPVVTVMGTTAASAGYLVALGGDYIIANEATLTGSIGVYMPLFDATKLAEKVGITANEITSGSLKTATSPFNARDARETAYLKNLVHQMNDVFYTYVTTRRPLNEKVKTQIRDGRALTGVDAVNKNLADALGNVRTAREWLEKNHKISQDVPLVDAEIEEDPLNMFRMVLSGNFFEPKQWLGQATTGGFWALKH